MEEYDPASTDPNVHKDSPSGAQTTVNPSPEQAAQPGPEQAPGQEAPRQFHTAPEQQPPDFIHPQPSGYVVDPATGRLFYTVPVMAQAAAAPFQNQPPQPNHTDQQAAVPPAAPDYGAVIKSVEQFAEGDATVADVVKTLYTTTAQDDQFWKGAIIGAAATVLLTSGPVGDAMGKTFSGLFGTSAPKGKTAPDAKDSTQTDKKE